jgi:excisionase family DNA binding protein
VTSERFLTLGDVAEILNISANQAYALVRSGDLKGIQIGGRNQWRVERAKLEEYIADAYKRTASHLGDLPAEIADVEADSLLPSQGRPTNDETLLRAERR